MYIRTYVFMGKHKPIMIRVSYTHKTKLTVRVACACVCVLRGKNCHSMLVTNFRG